MEAARAAGDRCIEVPKKLVEHDDPKVRLAATDQLLNRGFGKHRQAIESDTKHQIENHFVE